MIDRQRVMDEFANYTANYNANDPKIKLKIDHTYRVAFLAEEIAKSLNLSEDECDLAWVCGMLHDVGRFEQIRRYGTFSDANSIDHAVFGADLLFEEGLYDLFFEPNSPAVTAEWKAIAETAIRQHSAFRLSADLTEREMIFAQILRDADKIDILRVNVDTRTEDIYNVTTEELYRSEVSEETRNDFLEGHCVIREHKKTAVDNLVGMAGLVLELVYPLSRKLVREQGYLGQILSFQSENPDTKAWFAYMRDVLLNAE